MAKSLIPELASVAPGLIIFDKGGTLIDFGEMWRDWMITLADRLEAATGTELAAHLFHAMQYNPCSGQIAHDGPFATTPLEQLRDLTVDILIASGLGPHASKAAVSAAWHAPDPIARSRPLADLPAMFGALRELGAKIAVTTVDDRAPTKMAFAALGIDSYVDALVCGDDGVEIKPAPDMVWAVCQATGVDPPRAIVVGDSVTDMQMGRAAGAALVVGVPTGVAPREALAAHADLVLDTISDLLTT